MAPSYKIAVFLYPGADVLDFSGPVEVYSSTSPATAPDPYFTTTTFAFQNPVKASKGCLTYVPDATFKDIEPNIHEFDILLIPGAQPDTITAMLAKDEGKTLLSLIQRFSFLKPRQETGHRILQSVCTGSLFFAAAGILTGRTATTHHIALELLAELADAAVKKEGKSGIDVVRERWVDAGKAENGTRIVMAGGVSSGIDASLWVVEELVGKKAASSAAELMEFEPRSQKEGWGVGK